MPPKKKINTGVPPGATGPSPIIKQDPSPPTGEPPKKKFKLNGPKRPVERPTSVESDTIAVSRPRRVSAQTPRYKVEDVAMEDPTDGEDEAASPAASSTSAASSALSSAPPSPSSSKKSSKRSGSESPFRDATPDTTAYGQDFTNYYIQQDEPEKPAPKKRKTASGTASVKPSNVKVSVEKEQPKAKQAATVPKAVPAKSTKSSNGAKPAPVVQPHPQAFMNHRGLHQQGQQQRPPHVPPPGMMHAPRQGMPPGMPHGMPQGPPPGHYWAPPPPMPPPSPAAYNFSSYNPAQMIQKFVQARASDPADTVPEMIEKIEALSLHLGDFGGPSRPPAPKKVSMSGGGHPLDNFLDIIDGEDEKPEEDPEKAIKVIGEQDEPLRFGIEFIMNALGSWVESRARQEWQAEVMRNGGRSVQAIQKSKGPGRPKKYSEGDYETPAPLLGPGNFDYMASNEGQTIIAFQRVLDCGALQVGSVVPENLGMALRKLYLQIDKLINQNNRVDSSGWQPMSYTAQINAQRHRVEEWLAQEARHQQVMAQHYAERERHQHGMMPSRTSSAAVHQHQQRQPSSQGQMGQGQLSAPPPPQHILGSSGNVQVNPEHLSKNSNDTLPIDTTGRIQHLPTHHNFITLTNNTSSVPPGQQQVPTGPSQTNGHRSTGSATQSPKPATDSSIAKRTARSSLPVLTSNSSEGLSRALGRGSRRQFGQAPQDQTINSLDSATASPAPPQSGPGARRRSRLSESSTMSAAPQQHTTGFQAINKPAFSRDASQTATPPAQNTNGVLGMISAQSAANNTRKVRKSRISGLRNSQVDGAGDDSKGKATGGVEDAVMLSD